MFGRQERVREPRTASLKYTRYIQDVQTVCFRDLSLGRFVNSYSFDGVMLKQRPPYSWSLVKGRR